MNLLFPFPLKKIKFTSERIKLKKYYTVPVLFIIPVLLLIVSISLKNYQGPYFTRGQYDPSYAYLINSLNLAQLSGFGVGHVDHPGTPLQVFGAVVIKFVHLFNNHENDLAKEVIMNSESYLSKIDYTLIILNFLGLFVLGVITYKIYSSILVSILLQLTPFTTTSIFADFSYVRPENMLMFVICIFISFLILFINSRSLNFKKKLYYTIILGIICGLGIATKITFFPLIIIPFLLFRGIKFKLFFFTAVSVSFLIFVIPAISSENLKYFTHWVYSLFIHTKKYGRGAPSVFEPISFLLNVKTILLKEWFFDFAYFLICITLAVNLKFCYKDILQKLKNIHFKNKQDTGNVSSDDILHENNFRLAIGIFLAMTLQIIIVAKHYGNNYMFPALTLSVLGVFTSINILGISLHKNLSEKMSNIIYAILILIITVNGIYSFNSWKNYNKILTEESDKFLNYTKNNLNDSVIVTAIRVSSIEYAFWGTMPYAGTQKNTYLGILDSIYPSRIFFYNGRCYNFNEDTTETTNAFNKTNKIIFLSPNEANLNQFIDLLKTDYGINNTTIEKKFSSKNGEVYEIKINSY